MSDNDNSTWRKPSLCSNSGCAELMKRPGRHVAVRSSLHPDVVVDLGPDEAKPLFAAIKAGEYDYLLNDRLEG